MHVLETTQRLPITLAEAWDFFSNPNNLALITPPDMGFEITSEPFHRMYAGMIITYRVRPMLRIPVRWVTEITHVQEPNFFVDEQRFGPYRLWHHKHYFTEIPGGVEMKDVVHYKVPFWPLSEVAQHLFVQKRLDDIFSFRYKALEERFGTMPAK